MLLLQLWHSNQMEGHLVHLQGNILHPAVLLFTCPPAVFFKLIFIIGTISGYVYNDKTFFGLILNLN